MADPLTMAIYGLAGIGAFSVLNSLFHGGTTNTNPADSIMAMLQLQMMSQFMGQLMNAMQPKGNDIGALLGTIAPVIAVVLVLAILMKKMG